MTIIKSDYDDWSNKIHGLPCALYFYLIDVDDIDNYINNTSILGNCSAIQSVQLTPFLDKNDLNLKQIKYDVDRFGDETNFKQVLDDDGSINVLRIDGILKTHKTLNTFKCYTPQKSIGGSLNWRNESRLYNYPYMFAFITDHLNPPMEVKYHLCKANKNTLKVKNSISDRCSYGLYVDGYKNDNNGTLEAMISTDAHEIPCSSNAYNSWVASNKNQITQNIKNMQMSTMLQNQGISQQTMVNGLQGVVNGVGGVVGGLMGDVSSLTGGINSAIGTVGNVLASKNQIALNNRNVQNSIQNAMAQANDMKSIPNSMISMGSDVFYGLVNGEYGLYMYRYGLNIEMYKKLGDYFAMFGYKQNKILTPNIRNRYYYNYIKTVGANLKSNQIPRTHFEQLKSIFDNGVTIWHIDRKGVTVGDISKDNYEV